jgi:hypothetical protein
VGPVLRQGCVRGKVAQIEMAQIEQKKIVEITNIMH